jgi:hypothetical protein
VYSVGKKRVCWNHKQRLSSSVTMERTAWEWPTHIFLVHFTNREKVKLSLCLTTHYTMKALVEWLYRSTFSWPRNYLDVTGQLHAPAALPPGKETRYPLDRRLGGPQSRSGQYGEVKILDPIGLELRPLGRPAILLALAVHQARTFIWQGETFVDSVPISMVNTTK